MKPSSCKAKGRRLQQDVAKSLLEVFSTFHPDLEPEDIKSTSMGVCGVDVQFSPYAKKLIPLAIECKAVEALNVPKVFEEHYTKYAGKNEVPLLVHRRNRRDALVTLRWNDFLQIFSETKNR